MTVDEVVDLIKEKFQALDGILERIERFMDKHEDRSRILELRIQNAEKDIEILKTHVEKCPVKDGKFTALETQRLTLWNVLKYIMAWGGSAVLIAWLLGKI